MFNYQLGGFSKPQGQARPPRQFLRLYRLGGSELLFVKNVCMLKTFMSPGRPTLSHLLSNPAGALLSCLVPRRFRLFEFAAR